MGACSSHLLSLFNTISVILNYFFALRYEKILHTDSSWNSLSLIKNQLFFQEALFLWEKNLNDHNLSLLSMLTATRKFTISRPFQDRTECVYVCVVCMCFKKKIHHESLLKVPIQSYITSLILYFYTFLI